MGRASPSSLQPPRSQPLGVNETRFLDSPLAAPFGTFGSRTGPELRSRNHVEVPRRTRGVAAMRQAAPSMLKRQSPVARRYAVERTTVTPRGCRLLASYRVRSLEPPRTPGVKPRIRPERPLTPFPARENGVDGVYVRPVPTDRKGLGELREFIGRVRTVRHDFKQERALTE
eukprot:3932642-Prymnesium_polylepis.1